jgi:hypothetical protein
VNIRVSRVYLFVFQIIFYERIGDDEVINRVGAREDGRQFAVKAALTASGGESQGHGDDFLSKNEVLSLQAVPETEG